MATMTTMTLDDLTTRIRNAWGADTCATEDLPKWSRQNPARGQCGITALVVNDLLGGDLMLGEVHVNGERVDFHWWNCLPDGTEIDLTREQFEPNEVVTAGQVVRRPPEIQRFREEYEVLKLRVLAAQSAPQ